MDAKHVALEVISEISGVAIADLKPESELISNLGIDSPRALQMLVELEDRLDIEIDDKDVENLNTVGDILETIERRLVSKSN